MKQEQSNSFTSSLEAFEIEEGESCQTVIFLAAHDAQRPTKFLHRSAA
jgi:hypothetical protein